MSEIIISPSVLSADFAHLQRDIEMLNNSEAQWIHIDVMDGVFVPNISFGFPVLAAIRRHTKKLLDVHLMIEKPEHYIKQFKEAGADLLTVHFEGTIHLDSVIRQIKAEGLKAGVALNPATPVAAISPVAHLLDLLLIMSVNPGFGGQKFIPYSLAKIREAKALIAETNSAALLQVDGGVTTANAAQIKEAGANVLVAGSAVFGAKNPLEAIREMKSEK